MSAHAFDTNADTKNFAIFVTFGIRCRREKRTSTLQILSIADLLMRPLRSPFGNGLWYAERRGSTWACLIARPRQIDQLHSRLENREGARNHSWRGWHTRARRDLRRSRFPKAAGMRKTCLPVIKASRERACRWFLAPLELSNNVRPMLKLRLNN